MAEQQGGARDVKTRHHRVAGLVMTPVMARLGYETTVELDISLQSQLIDIICVRRERVVTPDLPPVYWAVFGGLNEHNLISFKSYSESFNGQSLEEFYGHLTNYCKVKKVRREQVNLYVITNHFPRGLLGPLQDTAHLKAVRGDDVYDLQISSLKTVRFIICSRTDNPILALFSTDVQRVLAAYTALQNEPNLVDDISIYWKQILRHIDKEIKNMYTKEDFLRDYPPTAEEPGILEWLEALAQKKLEQGQKTERIALLVQLLERRFETISDEVSAALANCTLDQLQALVNPALDAPNLDTFRSHLPEVDGADEAETATATDNPRDADDADSDATA